MVVAREKVAKLPADLLALNDPAIQGPVAFGVRDSKTVSDAEIRVRGEAEKLGPVVAPRRLVFEFDGRRSNEPEAQARANVSENPGFTVA